MWEFPSIQAFIGSNAFIILWTLLVSAASITAWTYFFISIKKNTNEPAGAFMKNLLSGAFTLLLAVFASWSVLSNYNETRQCRNLDLGKVKSLRVRKMAGENSYSGKTIFINDSEKVRNGLKILDKASSRSRNKDRFIYGYRIDLVLEAGAAEWISLYYFSETENSQKTDVIIPHCASDSDDVANTDNIYSSTAFGEWIRENVDPEFKKIQ